MIPQYFNVQNNFKYLDEKQTLNILILYNNGRIENKKIDYIEAIKNQEIFTLDYRDLNLLEPKKYNAENHLISLHNVKKIFFTSINDDLIKRDADNDVFYNVLFGIFGEEQEVKLLENEIDPKFILELNYFDINKREMEFNNSNLQHLTQKLFFLPVIYRTAKTTNSENLLKIGDFFQGGIICDTWFEGSTQKGLIVGERVLYNKTDLYWGNNYDSLVHYNLDGDGYEYGSAYDGLYNTQQIAIDFNKLNLHTFALQYSNEEKGTGIYDDWFVPSVFQFQSIFNNINKITQAMAIHFPSNNISIISYPTSNQFSATHFMAINTGYSYMLPMSKDNQLNQFLLVRKF